MMNKRLKLSFYRQDVLKIAPALLGKLLVRRFDNGIIKSYRIMETEAYRGEEDSACHARAGRTNRTKVLYKDGGVTYVYLCYGIHYLLNVVTGKKDQPQAVLIRALSNYDGPAKFTKALNITKELNEIDLTKSNSLWIEDDGYKAEYVTTKRIGIDYADEPYKSIEWRFKIKEEK